MMPLRWERIAVISCQCQPRSNLYLSTRMKPMTSHSAHTTFYEAPTIYVSWPWAASHGILQLYPHKVNSTRCSGIVSTTEGLLHLKSEPGGGFPLALTDGLSLRRMGRALAFYYISHSSIDKLPSPPISNLQPLCKPHVSYIR